MRQPQRIESRKRRTLRGWRMRRRRNARESTKHRRWSSPGQVLLVQRGSAAGPVLNGQPRSDGQPVDREVSSQNRVSLTVGGDQQRAVSLRGWRRLVSSSSTVSCLAAARSCYSHPRSVLSRVIENDREENREALGSVKCEWQVPLPSDGWLWCSSDL